MRVYKEEEVHVRTHEPIESLVVTKLKGRMTAVVMLARKGITPAKVQTFQRGNMEKRKPTEYGHRSEDEATNTKVKELLKYKVG
ncbi:unnamed protein product [Sphenostylis stenocarpa]|uniref:Uncharacterized protein n=1 Tax=Sphenostylis stenocarpa TaxID=92480 RepID=A0AA86S189_9FABA|nr:unnamed protein product [Sphenostylis stenocarpa]